MDRSIDRSIYHEDLNMQRIESKTQSNRLPPTTPIPWDPISTILVIVIIIITMCIYIYIYALQLNKILCYIIASSSLQNNTLVQGPGGPGPLAFAGSRLVRTLTNTKKCVLFILVICLGGNPIIARFPTSIQQARQVFSYTR